MLSSPTGLNICFASHVLAHTTQKHQWEPSTRVQKSASCPCFPPSWELPTSASQPPSSLKKHLQVPAHSYPLLPGMTRNPMLGKQHGSTQDSRTCPASYLEYKGDGWGSAGHWNHKDKSHSNTAFLKQERKTLLQVHNPEIPKAWPHCYSFGHKAWSKGRNLPTSPVGTGCVCLRCSTAQPLWGDARSWVICKYWVTVLQSPSIWNSERSLLCKTEQERLCGAQPPVWAPTCFCV